MNQHDYLQVRHGHIGPALLALPFRHHHSWPYMARKGVASCLNRLQNSYRA